MGIQVNECRFVSINCSNVNAANETEVYVFFNDAAIYYVGETNIIL